MSKRKHSEAIDSIQFKLVDVDEGDANGKQQIQQRKEQLKTVGIYSGTNFGEKTRLNLNSDGTLPISADAVRTISIYGMQNWTDGIGDEAMQWLSKLAAEQQQKMSKEQCKYCLNLFLAYEFKGDQEGTFATNLATLLRVPGLLRSVGAFHYSEGGNLATFLARFPQLVAEPDFPRRYDVHVYCENDTLVEHYFADVKHWLVNLGKKIPADNEKQTAETEPKPTLRQCRLKFVLDRADTAEEMLKLFKEDFDNAFAADGRRTFVVRLDCPGFSLDEFCYNNEKTGEVLAFAFKHSQVLKAEEDDDKMTDGEEEKSREAEAAAPEGKRCRSTTTTTAPEGEANDEAEPKQDEDEEAESVVEWNTYHLIRCLSADREQMSAVEVPFLRNSLSIIH
ncbi:hypothetical protein niasHT_037833 [Heterodera trifolii]|uniref:UBX domain-containing protein n=1 Tax=Heterodera trifolii TaxID=157864 RepID=A0ABD2IX25_9BILA